TASANQATALKKRSSQVRGDLDWIVMKALEKDRIRRYETVGAFAADVQRYLADEPVLARPPSTLYRLRKVARRKKGLITAATAIGVALLVAVPTLVVSSVLVLQAKKDLERELYLHGIALADRELPNLGPGRALKILDECPKVLRDWEWHCLKRLCRLD